MRGRRRRERVALPVAVPGSLEAHVADYLDELRTKNFAEGTVLARLADLRQFATWCGERGLMRPGEITRAILERYQRHLHHYRRADGRALSFRTQQYRLISLRGFFRHLARGHVIDANPAADLELPRVGWRLPAEALSASEAERVLAQPDVGKPLGLRDRAILETFYSTGMRRMELAGLRVDGIDEERGTALIRQGKGRKDRMVPLGERALAWIAKYREDVRPELTAGRSRHELFLNELGEPIGLEWLTIMVRRYVERAGVGKRGACHLFRHTAATLMLEGGADVRYVQELLGHAKLDTTQVYTHVSIRTLKAIHDATHPGARLGRREKPSSAPGAGASAAEMLRQAAQVAPEPSSSLAADPFASPSEDAAQEREDGLDEDLDR